MQISHKPDKIFKRGEIVAVLNTKTADPDHYELFRIGDVEYLSLKLTPVNTLVLKEEFIIPEIRLGEAYKYEQYGDQFEFNVQFYADNEYCVNVNPFQFG